MIGNSVTSIGNEAFGKCSGLTSIVIPNSVTNIGFSAFGSRINKVYISDLIAWCSIDFENPVWSTATDLYLNGELLTKLVIPDCITEIKDCAFCNCSSIKNVVIPNRVTSIGSSAFSGCTGLTSITIPNSVTSIGEWAFYGCTGLISIEIPNSVTSIGSFAFRGCTGLKEVYISDIATWCNIEFDGSDNNPLCYSANLYLNGELFTELVIPADVTNIKNYLSHFKKSNLSSITVAEGNTKYDSRDNCNAVIETATNILIAGCKNTIIPNSVTSIECSAFYDCTGLAGELIIPNSVTSIGEDAFYNCAGLTSIVIGNSVTSIGNNAFDRCTSLKELRIEDGTEMLSLGYNDDSGLFFDCPLETLYLGRNLSYKTDSDYKRSPFYRHKKLTSLTIGNCVSSIGDGAFYNCSGLTSIVIPNSVTSIGKYAFNNCTGLTSIEIPNSITSIGEKAFYGTAWNDNLSDGIIYVGNVLYGYKGTMPENTSLVVEDGILGIADYAFEKCTGLASIEIPNSVTSIGYDAFKECNSLKEVHISNIVAWCNISFGSSNANPLYFAKNLYLNDEKVTDLVIPNSVTSIGEYAFDGCTGLTSIEIPNSVTSIGDYAFDGCSGLTSITIPNSVASIGYAAFRDCTSLKELSIEDGEEVLDLEYNNELTYNCPLETLYLGRDLHYSGSSPFLQSTLKSVIFGNSVTSIGNKAFYNCAGLTSIVIGNSVTSIGNEAFVKCFGLTSIVIGNSVTSIGDKAFYDCSGLTSIVIGNSVTSIGDYAFNGCTGLKTVYNFSNLTLAKRSRDYGYVAYYANEVINAPNCYMLGDCIFTKPNGVNTLVEYLGNDIELTLPADCNGEDYVIGVKAFYGNTTLTSIVIPNNVTGISDDAFNGCENLKTVINFSNLTFSKGSSDYGYVAYYADKVYNAPNGSIEGEFIFGKPNDANTLVGYLGNATEITLPADYKGENYVIGAEAFYGNTTLTCIVIPNNVTSIGDDAFNGCENLKTVINFSNLTFSKGSSDYGYVAYYADKVYNAPNGSIEGDFVFGKPNDVNTLLYYLGNTANLILPTDYKGENYAIGDNVFKEYIELTSVVIPNSVTSIGNYAFNGCTSLKELRIEDGESTLSLGYNTYDSSYIGKGLFYDCPLETLYLGRNLSYNTGYSYGYSPFYNIETLVNVTIGKNVTTIGSYAFYYCTGLKSITIPNSVTSIGNSAFAYCYGLTSITIPNSATSIGSYAFAYCSGLTSVEIPNSVTSIGDDAFLYCTGLTSITIPNSVTSIGNYAFYNCTGLTSIEIPNSVTSIGSSAFAYCSGLTSIVVDGNNTKYDSREDCNAIIETETNTLVSGCKNTVIPSSVTSIGEDAFAYCYGLTSVEIPNSVTSIGDNAFAYCYGLTSVEIPNSVTSIGNSAFSGCTGLTSITIPNSVTSIGEWAFYGCTGLTSIEIPNSVTSIGSSAFADCTGLTSITIPNSVTSIGYSAFLGCTGLTSIEIPNSVTNIENVAFKGCTSLKELSIEDGTEILYLGCNNYVGTGKGLFYDCPLETLYLGRNLSYNTDSYPFYGKETLASVTISNNVTSIGNDMFNGCESLKTVINFSNLTFCKGSSDYGYVAYYADNVYNVPNGSIEGDFIFGKPNDVNTLLYYLGNTTDLTLPIDYKGEDYVIGSAVFKDNTVITSIEIPSSVTSIGNEAFWGCKEVTNINIIDGVKSIGNSAFYGCNDLETLYISNTIESIGDYAFAECNNIFDIKIGSKKAITASENIFSSDAYNNACLYVPTGRKFAYEKTTPWNNFYIVEMDFTGIDEVYDEVKGEGGKVEGVYYDLSGRAVENPANGVYIVNGKKVVIK